METPLEKLNAKIFAEHLHSRFRMNDGGAAVELELIEVNEPPSVPKVELFTLSFRGPAAPRLMQRIYRLEHQKLGNVQIFLTPVAGDAQSITYEAVFNRVRR